MNIAELSLPTSEDMAPPSEVVEDGNTAVGVVVPRSNPPPGLESDQLAVSQMD